jgi:hypothetical protein
MTGFQNERNAIMTNSVNLSFTTQLTQRTAGLSASDYIINFEDPIAVDSRNDSGPSA